MSTLGAILAAYLFFMFPMFGIVMLWLILHNDNPIYHSAIMPLLIVTGYYFFSVRKFAANYEESFIQESIANTLKERMELALDGSNTSILDWDVKSGEFFISESWKVMLGYRDDELKNAVETWMSRVHERDRRRVFVQLEECFRKNEKIFESIHRLRHKDGHYIWILGRAQVFYNKHGEAVRMVGTHTDITTSKEIEADIAEKNKILEESQRLAHIGSWKYSFAEDKMSCTEEMYRIFELDTTEDISYQLFRDAIHPNDKKMVEERYRQSLKDRKHYTITYRLLLESKQVKYVREECENIFDVKGKALFSIGTIQDITEQKLLENNLNKQKETLFYLAHHDTLTKLPNRILFNDRLSLAIEKAKRNDSIFAVLFLDLDNFKEINDSLGHDVGDEVLKEVTKRFKSIIRKEDTLARLGGDEFTIIMDNLKDGENASILAQKILDALIEPVTIYDKTLYLSCSIGISLYPNDGYLPQDLLKYADAAMYKAKAQGRNTFQFYSAEMTELALERVNMETSLRDGLQRDEFVVYYQPQVNGKEDKLIGMEALVRWMHPTEGLIPPGRFVPLAEATGLIVQLDYFVMRTAMQQFAQWYKEGYTPGVLALNLSMKLLEQKDFFHNIVAIISETKCNPKWIEFEVTEGQIMTNPQEAINILMKISDLGISVSVDDFGTGYSSLSYLKKLPISKLKIDQSFIKELPNDEDGAIVKAVIALANSLNLRVIAEGVETKEQRDFLVENCCENIQGYYYSKPLPKEKLQDILQKGIL